MVILGKEAEFQGLGGMGGAAESIISFSLGWRGVALVSYVTFSLNLSELFPENGLGSGMR